TMLVLVHGGAAVVPPSRVESKLADLRKSAKAGFVALLRQNGEVVKNKRGAYPALEAVQSAVQVMENSPYFNAGYGSSLTSAGQVEMDAIVACGKSLDFGAVSSVTSFQNPVTVARCV